MNELFIKLLEALRGEDMFYATYSNTSGAMVGVWINDKAYEIRIEEHKSEQG